MYEVMAGIDGLTFTAHTDSWAKVSESIETLLKVTDKVWVSKAGQTDVRLFEVNGPALGRTVDGNPENIYSDLM